VAREKYFDVATVKYFDKTGLAELFIGARLLVYSTRVQNAAFKPGFWPQLKNSKKFRLFFIPRLAFVHCLFFVLFMCISSVRQTKFQKMSVKNSRRKRTKNFTRSSANWILPWDKHFTLPIGGKFSGRPTT